MIAADAPRLVPPAASRPGAVAAAGFAVAWAALSSGYYLFAEYLFRHGFLALNLMFFAEKAALATSGAPPRLVNVGFVYPPLSFVLMLPFHDPVVAQAVIAGAVVAGIFRFLDGRVPESGVRRLAKAYVLCSPLFLYPAVENYGFLLLAVLLALAVLNIGRYLDYGYSLYVFGAGVLYGLTFFIDFRTIFLLVVIVPAVYVPLARRSHAQALCVALALSVPVLFMAGSWMYVNWVFLGDGLAFVYGKGSFFRTQIVPPEVLAAGGDPFATAVLLGRWILASLPVTAAYFAGAALLRAGRSAYLIPTWILYGLPLAFVGLSLYAGVFAPYTSVLLLFVLVLIYELPRMRRTRLLAAMLALSFVCSFAAPLVSANAEERTFARALLTGSVAPNLTEYRAVADALSAHGDGPVLLDDTIFYPVIFLTGEPQRFILPYQYEYETALANPRLARYVVASRHDTSDALTATHPTIADGTLPGFAVVATTAHYLVFARSEGRS